MNFSSSLLEALIGGVFEFLFLLPPGIRKGMAKTAPSVAMDSYRLSVSAMQRVAVFNRDSTPM